MRQLALEFAQNIQPFLSKDQLQEIADALNGGTYRFVVVHNYIYIYIYMYIQLKRHNIVM